jgi:hypothetical protein
MLLRERFAAFGTGAAYHDARVTDEHMGKGVAPQEVGGRLADADRVKDEADILGIDMAPSTGKHMVKEHVLADSLALLTGRDALRYMLMMVHG